MQEIKKPRILVMLRLIKTGLLIGFVAILTVPATTYAVTGSNWRAGNIIDDDIFYNNNDMSIADIQNFLNSKVSTCDTWGTQIYSGSQTRAQYGTSRGYPPPYTCLKDYSQNGKSSAQIIKEAADANNVSTRALIVLLQKEQSLVTDDWPWSIQYRSATGYGCPDTAPCDAQYYGFYNQVNKAAWQFRRYATVPNSYRYKPFQNNYIQYNPNAGCGGTNVFIENYATAGLYNYTPYQPNASALVNLFGEGDACGAYGNRNFWRLFNDWFSSTISGIAKFQSYDRPHPTGALIRKVGDPRIYKMVEGTKVLLPNFEVMLSHGYSEANVKIWNVADQYATINTEKLGYRSGTLIRENGSQKIYVIECTNQFYSSCIKRHIASYEVYLSLGYRDNEVLQTGYNHLADIPLGAPVTSSTTHPNGTLVRESHTGKIYLIKNGVRYYVQSWYLFQINRFDLSKVRTMSAGDSSLPKNETFPVYDSPLLARPIGDVRIFSISDNLYGTTYKRHLSNFDVFSLLGYQESDVVPLESSLTNSYVTVTPIQ